MKNRPPPGAPKENMTIGRSQKMIPVKFIARQSVPRNEREYLPAIVVESEDPHVAAAPKVSMLVENGVIHAIAGNAVFNPEGFNASHSIIEFYKTIPHTHSTKNNHQS